jgi:hypothetical protein
MTDDETKAIVGGILTEALKKSVEKRAERFGPPDTPATPGAVLRVPDSLLKGHGVPYPASICVLRIDGGDAVSVPIRVGGEPAFGEFAIAEGLSPFNGKMILETDCQLRFPLGALQQFKAIAKCPAAAEMPHALMVAVPANKQGVFAAWQALIRALRSQG